MLPQTELEDYIKYLYSSINISNPDELIMDDIAQKLNIEILHSSFLNKSVRVNGRVAINLNISLTRLEDQWETFGHELFHALKDAGNQIYFPAPLRELRENKAKNFALHFCVPTFMLDQLKWPDSNAAVFAANQFHVTLDFAEQRMEQYRNKILQKQVDDLQMKELCAEERERYITAFIPFSLQNCTVETKRIMAQLSKQTGVEFK